MTDYFLANPPAQPKLEIARYVASCGINVPDDIYSESTPALQSNDEIVARSEHPQDYDGYSDMMRSVLFHPQ